MPTRSAGIIVAFSLAAAVSANAQGPPNLRPLTPLARQLLGQGLEFSATVRAIVEGLSGTDVIVQIRTGRWEPEEGRCHANIRFVGAGPGARFVRIWVDAWWQSRLDQVALLAHELQHALEIGRTPDARDTAAVEALFRRIGYEGAGTAFETAAARATQTAVAVELAAARARRR